MSNNGSITITLEGSNASTSLPLLSGSLGPQVADIRKLYADLGIFTFDPGYGETASCESKITYIDGDEGVLLYRGYPIAQLAENSDFIEVCYLLMYGELPNKAQLAEFRTGVTRHTMVHEQIRQFFNGFRRDAHPMAIMCGVVGALAAFYHDNLDINDARQREIAAFRLIAKVPTIAGDGLQVRARPALRVPAQRPQLRGNFLHMLNACRPSPTTSRPCWSARWTASWSCTPTTSRTPPPHGAPRRLHGRQPLRLHRRRHRALWGPAHGGANEAVLKMLGEIGTPRTSRLHRQVKDKNANVKLMGFGHRVYKNFDPRAKIMKETCHEVLASSASRTSRCSTWRWRWSASR
jgi:citrate synthase